MPYSYYNAQPTGGLYCRPVTCIEEVRATPVDFSGNPMVFIDAAHGMVYTKIFNSATGDSEIIQYRRVNAQQMQPVTMEAFSQLHKSVEDIRRELDAMKNVREEYYAEHDPQHPDRYSQRRRPYADDYDRGGEQSRLETSEQYLARQKRSTAGADRPEYVPGERD